MPDKEGVKVEILSLGQILQQEPDLYVSILEVDRISLFFLLYKVEGVSSLPLDLCKSHFKKCGDVFSYGLCEFLTG